MRENRQLSDEAMRAQRPDEFRAVFAGLGGDGGSDAADRRRARAILCTRLNALHDALQWEAKGRPERPGFPLSRASFNPNNATCRLTQAEFDTLLADHGLALSDLHHGMQLG